MGGCIARDGAQRNRVWGWRRKRGRWTRGRVSPAGGAAGLRLGWDGGVGGVGEPGSEPSTPLPTGWAFPGLDPQTLLPWLALPSFEIACLPTPALSSVICTPTDAQTEGAGPDAGRCPAGASDGMGVAGRNPGLPGEGWRAWGGGWAGAEASRSRVCLGAAEWNRWLGRGEGTWRGGGGVRGPEDEERGISTPRVSQEKPPSPSLPRKRGIAPAFIPESASSQGAPLLPRPTRRGPGRGRQGRREPPGAPGLRGPHSEGRGGGGKPAPSWERVQGS